MIVTRKRYLDRLLEFKDEDLIKVVTGVRRCGKSTLLEMMQEHLIAGGVPESRTVMLKMESVEFDDLPDYRALYKLIREKVDGVEHPYIFLDELQDIDGWEKAVNSLRVDVDCDIYITGSNAFLLSSELSTLLSGRYVEIEMLPLSFAEYIDFRRAKPIDGGRNGLALLEDGTPIPLSELRSPSSHRASPTGAATRPTASRFTIPSSCATSSSVTAGESRAGSRIPPCSSAYAHSYPITSGTRTRSTASPAQCGPKTGRQRTARSTATSGPCAKPTSSTPSSDTTSRGNSCLRQTGSTTSSIQD